VAGGEEGGGASVGDSGGRSCSGKKKAKAAFGFLRFSEARDVNSEGANAEVGCWARWAENEERRRPGRIPCSGWNPKE
jgi:hypothetical protein